jgi:hypothetical protein
VFEASLDEDAYLLDGVGGLADVVSRAMRTYRSSPKLTTLKTRSKNILLEDFFSFLKLDYSWQIWGLLSFFLKRAHGQGRPDR